MKWLRQQRDGAYIMSFSVRTGTESGNYLNSNLIRCPKGNAVNFIQASNFFFF